MPLKEKSQLQKRIESFAWRIGGTSLVALLGFLIQPETIKAFAEEGLVIPAIVIGIIGLAIGEVTKWMNKRGRQPVRGV